MTQILAVRSAFPPHRYPQEECTRAFADLAGLRPAQRALLERVSRNAGVDTRHTALPLAQYATLSGVAAANDRYVTEATTLAGRALGAALAAAGVPAAEVDLLLLTSVTGVSVPSLDARLIPGAGLRADVKRLPVFGLGCVAGAAGLARLHDYLLGWPEHVAALVSVELCSLTVPRAQVTTADLVAGALFGDGAAAVIATGTNGAGAGASANGASARRRPPQVIATHSEVYPGSGDALGWRLADEGWRIVLRTELAAVVEQRIGPTVTKFLAGHGLAPEDIGTWICHPGGPKVIDAVRDGLGLPEDAVAASRRSLAAVGNLSSASVLHILEQLQPPGPAAAGPAGEHGGGQRHCLMVGLGPGVSVELVLMRW